MNELADAKRRAEILRRQQYEATTKALSPIALAASIDEKPHTTVASRLWRDMQHVGKPIGGGM